jgi:hypothetical protein
MNACIAESLYLTGMNLPQLNSHELQSFLNQKDFVDATVAQINKDLQGLFYGNFEAAKTPENNLLENLVQPLKPILVELSKRQPEQLSQFIYRVDLAEKKFFESLSSDETLQRLSLLIIEREALKVYLRLKFSERI